MAARLARCLPSAGARRAEEARTAPMAHQGTRLLGGPELPPPAQAARRPYRRTHTQALGMLWLAVVQGAG